ncbi:FAR1-related sequence 5-like protein [Tanacetum coccineum]|uniref:FAR1-related sequence 5-like protein n=1 Tax=Tanacetum coccineum TaxID=301880 RepID=A0ABQ5I0E1_9ASTR
MKAFKMMKELFGDFDEVGATLVDCKNFKWGIDLFIGEFDVEMVFELLLNKHEYINRFSCDYLTNDDGNLSSLFWEDKVAKHKYLSFDDVISFDAMFCSNNVTFAAALISNKTAESYGWLLRGFQKAFVREPIVVVTDQDPAMKIAIEKEFINSRHRLCIWQIMEKLSTKVLFTPSDVTLSCTCKQFERHGLLCRHNFYVLRIYGVNEFPKRYVSRRWTRDAVTREKQAGFDGRNKFSDGSIRDEIVKDIIGSVEYYIDKLASNIEELAIYRYRL